MWRKFTTTGLLGGFLILMITTEAISQNIPFEKPYFKGRMKEYRKAVRSIKQGNVFYDSHLRGHRQALGYYMVAYNINPNNDQLNLRIGDCYVHMDNYEKALEYLDKALDLNPNINPIVYYYQAQVYHLLEQWDKAEELYLTYKNEYKGRNADTIKMIEKSLEEVKSGRNFSRTPLGYKIENLGERLNTQFEDYVPIISSDGKMMIFTSRRPASSKKKDQRVSAFDYGLMENVYVASQDDEGNWSSPKAVKVMNAKNGHSAGIGISADNKQLFVYIDKRGGDLYVAQKDGNSFKKPKKLKGHINSKWQEPHISLTPDGKTAYFVSNRPGGAGGKDIYVSKKDSKEKWGKPKSVGANINTPYDEDAVYISPDGSTMFFSSRGHNSMGGYDIFESSFVDGQWTTPQNLAYPINSPGNDIFFTRTGDGQSAYFSSSRAKGLGSLDLYYIAKFPTDSIRMFYYALIAKIIEENTNNPVATPAIIEIVEIKTQEKFFEGIAKAPKAEFETKLPAGKTYALTVHAEGYLFYSENIDLKEATEDQKIQKTIVLKPVRAEETMVLNNVFFDFDRATITPDSEPELQRAVEILSKYTSHRIEIYGHTDNIGPDYYNQKLSERRAHSVKQYLVKKGIAEDRIVKVEGLGESQPVDSNDNAQGRAKNRRVEFKLVK